MTSRRVASLQQRLNDAFTPLALRVEDESALHRGHAGAADGRGHFRIYLVAEQFVGMARLARHRAVFEALGALMQTDVHALSIDARAPDEASS